MTTWMEAIRTLSPHAAPAVLVTVAHTQGSVPREAGAKMIVGADAQFDTIGGGHLELQACAIAREMLAPGTRARRLQRFALGPSLGQCCGGAVQLAFERLDEHGWKVLKLLAQEHAAGRSACRLVSLQSAQREEVLLDEDGRRLMGTTPVPPSFSPARSCHLLQDEQGEAWLVDPCHPVRAHLVLFGAGHVGAALVQALADLPCRVTWVDEREDVFPSRLPENVRIESTDVPEAIVDEAEAGSSFLVMTHSHALDLRLAETILKRDAPGWFGLIGSATKRAQFEHRLCERGIAEDRLAAMTCPIGLHGISGKMPSVIAASVCAQLLQVWEAAGLLPST